VPLRKFNQKINAGGTEQDAKAKLPLVEKLSSTSAPLLIIGFVLGFFGSRTVPAWLVGTD
jgi:hypothetical protein